MVNCSFKQWPVRFTKTRCFPLTAKKTCKLQTAQECGFIFHATIKISFNLVFAAISSNFV